MPAVIPFIPLISQGVGLAAGAIAGKKRQASAMKRSPEEQIALGGAQRGAGQLATTGASLTAEGRPQTRAAGNYYDTLLRGSRAKQQQVLAPYAAQLGEQAAGAQRSLEHGGLRGAARDQGIANLARGRQSAISSMVTGMQPWAAGQLGELGKWNIGQGGQQTGAGADIYGNLLGHGAENRRYARQEGAEFGSAVGGLIADVGKTVGGVLQNRQDDGDGGGGLNPQSRPGTPTLPTNPGAWPSTTRSGGLPRSVPPQRPGFGGWQY